MRDRLIGLLKSPHKAEQLRQMSVNIDKYGDDCVEAMVADFLLANGVIVPPCKVGDTVYQFVNWCDYTNCHFEGCAGCSHCNDLGIKEICFNYSHINQLGKTVFLTKEEAEKELERRKK